MVIDVREQGMQQKSVAFITLGCAKNEVDTAHMREKVAAAGYELIEEPENASAIIINTCSFIQAATEESLETILEAADLPRVACGEASLIVAGCMPARYGSELESELSEAGAFVPCSREDDIVSVLVDVIGEPYAYANFEIEGLPAHSPASLTRTPSVFSYVKISDGCDRFCSYCTIPYIRGRYRSFSLADIQVEVAKEIAAGAREIVLIAQDTGRWGTDFEEPSTLAALVSTLAKAHGDTWFRVMYLQPEGLTDEYLEAVATHENICSYFDIPLQHVNATILKAMNRTGSRLEFDSLTKRVRTRIPQATLRTTLIAGFPGETEDQFEELCDFVQEADFDYVGVFPYSREEGTRAFDLPHQVDEEEKQSRAQQLRDLADAVCTPRIAARVGLSMPVLVEGFEEDDQLFGRAMCQAPEVDGVTFLSEGTVGEIRSVLIQDTLLYEMEGV